MNSDQIKMINGTVLEMSKMTVEKQFDYHKYQATYISDYIKFADTKAGLTLGVAGVIFAFFIKIFKELWKYGFEIEFFRNWNFYGYIISLILLAIGIYHLISTIWPRYYIDKNLYHSWGGISDFDSEKDYITFMSVKFNDEESFLKALMAQNYSLAGVCTTKYKKLRIAYYCLGFGVWWSGTA